MTSTVNRVQRARVALLVAGVSVVAIARMAGLPANLTAAQAPMATATPAPTPEPGQCVAWGDKATTDEIHLGETAGVTLTFKAKCVGCTMPLHLVLVIDGSASMAGQQGRRMLAAAENLVRRIDLDDNPEISVAVVDFNTRARTLCDLTNNQARVLGCLGRVRFAGGRAIDRGIEEAEQVLLRERLKSTYCDPEDIIVVFSDWMNDGSCIPAIGAAAGAKRKSILIVTVRVGRDCDERCARQVASAQRYVFAVDDWADIYAVIREISAEIILLRVKRLTITDRLPGNMHYVASSAKPVPTLLSPSGDELLWEMLDVPAEGITVTFEVEPQEMGRHPANVVARAVFTATNLQSDSFVYPVPHVLVEPRPSATLTPTTAPTTTATGVPPTAPTPAPTRSAAMYVPYVARH